MHVGAQHRGPQAAEEKRWGMQGPDPRKRARRDIAGALIGAEAGAGLGLLVLGSVPFAPLGMAALGAAAGFGVMRVHHLVARRWLRHQLRAAR